MLICTQEFSADDDSFNIYAGESMSSRDEDTGKGISYAGEEGASPSAGQGKFLTITQQ